MSQEKDSTDWNLNCWKTKMERVDNSQEAIHFDWSRTSKVKNNVMSLLEITLNKINKLKLKFKRPHLLFPNAGKI